MVESNASAMQQAANAPTSGGLADMMNFYDLDGDGKSDSVKTDKTIFDMCDFEPAGTVKLLSEHALISRSTLRGVPEGETLSLGNTQTDSMNPVPSRLRSIDIQEAHGCRVEVENAIIDGMKIDGEYTLSIKRAQVNDPVLTDNVTLQLGAGGVCNRVTIKDARFGPESDFAGGSFQGGEIENTSFDGVNCAGARFSGLHMKNVSGTISGATMSNMTLENVANLVITEDTQLHNVCVRNPATGKYERFDDAVNFQDFQQKIADLGSIRSTAMEWQKELLPKAAVAAVQSIEQAAGMASHELKATPAAAVLNPAPLMTGDATQPGQIVSGGLTRSDETERDTISRTSTTPEYTGGIRVEGNATDAQLGSFNAPSFDTPEGRAAAYKLAAERTAAAMDLG